MPHTNLLSCKLGVRSCLGLALLPVCLAGCAVDQRQEMATYQFLILQDVPPVRYRPGEVLTLEAAMALAVRNSEALSLRGEDYLQAVIDKQRAVAAFLPTISFNPSYYKQDPSRYTSPSGRVNERADVPIEGQMNLFNGLSDLARYRGSEATIEQRKQILLDAKASQVLDVARVYYATLKADRSVTVLENSLAVQDENVRRAKQARNAGLGVMLDVAQSEAQAASTRGALIQAQGDARNGRNVLSYLVCVPLYDAPLEDVYVLPREAPPVEELMRRAEVGRRDLAAAVAASTAARQNVEVQVGRYYPSVTLNLAYFLDHQSVYSDSYWNGLLQANMPIFEAGIIRADVRAAWSRFRQAKLVESQLRRQIEQDVRVARENFLTSQARGDQLVMQLRAARDAYALADASWHAGTQTYLDRLVALDRLLSTELLKVSADLDRKVFYLTMLRSTGQLGTRLAAQPSTKPVTAPTTAPATTRSTGQ